MKVHREQRGEDVEEGYSSAHTSIFACGHNGAVATTVATVTICGDCSNDFDTDSNAVGAVCVESDAFSGNVHYRLCGHCVVTITSR